MSKDFAITDMSLQEDDGLLDGIHCLAQRFVIELFTEIGSMQYLKHRGCSFLTQLKEATTEVDIFGAFMCALHRVKKNLRADEDKQTPDEQRFKDAKLERVTIDNGTIQLLVTITSKLDDTVVVDLPKINL